VTELTQEQKDAAAKATADAAAEKAKQDADAAAEAARLAAEAGDPYKGLALPKDASEAFDVKAVDRVKELAKTHKISLEAAQAILELTHAEVSDTVAVVGETVKKGGAVWKAQVAALEAASLADPDLGAGSPQKLVDVRLKAELHLNAENPALKQKLHDAGLLADPDVLKYLQTRVRLEAEGRKFVEGDRLPPPPKPPETRDRYNADGSPKKVEPPAT
jgi:hypothetical protein